MSTISPGSREKQGLCSIANSVILRHSSASAGTLRGRPGNKRPQHIFSKAISGLRTQTNRLLDKCSSIFRLFTWDFKGRNISRSWETARYSSRLGGFQLKNRKRTRNVTQFQLGSVIEASTEKDSNSNYVTLHERHDTL